MDILIVKLAALGDVLRTTSLLRPLHRRYPGCRITWVCSKQAKPLLAGNPWIQEIAVWPGASRGSARRFDLALSLEEDIGTAAFAARACRGSLIGVRVEDGQLGFTESSAPYYSMSLLSRDADGRHENADRLKASNRKTYAEIWLDILRLPKPAKISELAPILVLAEKDREAARRLSKKHSLGEGKAGPIGFNPGAGTRWPSKQISVEHSAAIADALHQQLKRPVLLLGGKDESRRNAQIAKLSRAPVIDAGTGHGLRIFAGILELCELVVSTDSLAFHVATALGKPAIVLVGPTSATELDVFGCGRKVLPPQGCSCFYRPECRFASSCLDRLPIANVLRAARAVLS